MNSKLNKFDGSKFEMEMIEKFKEVGWDTMSPNSEYDSTYSRYDIPLNYNNKPFGIVELFHINGDDSNAILNMGRTIKNKMELLEKVKGKLPLLVITDGVFFYVSYEGSEFNEQHFIPRPSHFQL